MTDNNGTIIATNANNVSLLQDHREVRLYNKIWELLEETAEDNNPLTCSAVTGILDSIKLEIQINSFSTEEDY